VESTSYSWNKTEQGTHILEEVIQGEILEIMKSFYEIGQIPLANPGKYCLFK
jgi:hypothetical protein